MFEFLGRELLPTHSPNDVSGFLSGCAALSLILFAAQHNMLAQETVVARKRPAADAPSLSRAVTMTLPLGGTAAAVGTASAAAAAAETKKTPSVGNGVAVASVASVPAAAPRPSSSNPRKRKEPPEGAETGRPPVHPPSQRSDSDGSTAAAAGGADAPARQLSYYERFKKLRTESGTGVAGGKSALDVFKEQTKPVTPSLSSGSLSSSASSSSSRGSGSGGAAAAAAAAEAKPVVLGVLRVTLVAGRGNRQPLSVYSTRAIKAAIAGDLIRGYTLFDHRKLQLIASFVHKEEAKRKKTVGSAPLPAAR